MRELLYVSSCSMVCSSVGGQVAGCVGGCGQVTRWVNCIWRQGHPQIVPDRISRICCASPRPTRASGLGRNLRCSTFKRSTFNDHPHNFGRGRSPRVFVPFSSTQSSRGDHNTHASFIYILRRRRHAASMLNLNISKRQHLLLL